MEMGISDGVSMRIEYLVFGERIVQKTLHVFTSCQVLVRLLCHLTF